QSFALAWLARQIPASGEASAGAALLCSALLCSAAARAALRGFSCSHPTHVRLVNDSAGPCAAGSAGARLLHASDSGGRTSAGVQCSAVQCSAADSRPAQQRGTLPSRRPLCIRPVLTGVFVVLCLVHSWR